MPQRKRIGILAPRTAQFADSVERDTGVLLLDTVSTTVWMALDTIGLDPVCIEGWGRIFSGGRA